MFNVSLRKLRGSAGAPRHEKPHRAACRKGKKEICKNNYWGVVLLLRLCNKHPLNLASQGFSNFCLWLKNQSFWFLKGKVCGFQILKWQKSSRSSQIISRSFNCLKDEVEFVVLSFVITQTQHRDSTSSASLYVTQRLNYALLMFVMQTPSLKNACCYLE